MPASPTHCKKAVGRHHRAFATTPRLSHSGPQTPHLSLAFLSLTRELVHLLPLFAQLPPDVRHLGVAVLNLGVPARMEGNVLTHHVTDQTTQLQNAAPGHAARRPGCIAQVDSAG